MSQEILIEEREVYGHPKYYPKCDNAKLFAAIAGTTTLTELAIRRITKLGYKVKTVPRVNKFEGEIA